MPSPPDLSDELHAFSGTHIVSGEDYADLVFSGCSCEDETVADINFSRVAFDKTNARTAQLARLHLSDVRLTGCDLANSSCSACTARRAELRDCRLTGFSFSEGTVDDARLSDCKIDLAIFHHTRFSNCRFERCDLRGADFEGADLRRVAFRDCDLREARMVDASLAGTDFRGSRVEGLLVQAGRLAGAVIDPTQAVDFAGLVGLIVRARGDELEPGDDEE